MANPIVLTGETVFLPLRESEGLAKDSLLIIFKAVVTDGYANVFHSLSKLALVCKSWKQTADCLEIGRCLFHHLGWRFPKQSPHNWKAAYRLQTGNLFIQTQDLKPKVTTLAYPPIPLMHQQRLKWIEDKGFVFYRHGGSEFNVCLFDNPKEPRKVKTDAGITALSVFKEHVVCGLQNGSIGAFHIETLKPSLSYQAHQATDTIQDIFEAGDAWISVSNLEIVRYDPSTCLSYCLLKDYNLHIKNSIYPSMHCINQYLFFKFDPSEEIARTPICYSMLSLRKPHGLEKVPGPKQGGLRQTLSWGDQIASLFLSSKHEFQDGKYSQTLETFTFCRFPFHPLSVYRGEAEAETTPRHTIVIEHRKKIMSERWQFHFRGDIACIIWDDYKSPEVKTSLYHIQFIDLKNGGKVIFEHCDPHIDIYRATIANNKFIYLQPHLSQAVILEFPIIPPIS